MKKNILLLLLSLIIFGTAACSRSGKTVNIADQTDVMHQATVPDTTVTNPPTSAAPESTAPAFSVPGQKKDGVSPSVTSGFTAVSHTTFTGLSPLPSVSFEVHDPDNERGLSTKRVDFGFGVSVDGKPHRYTLDNQNYFDSGNYNAVCIDRVSSGKPLYLTFDCGYENGLTSDILDTLRAKAVPAAFFCTLSHIKDQPELIARMINEGHIIGNHSTSHANFSQISRTHMVQEIMDCDNYLRLNFGYTSPYFRFPEGCYSDCALELVSDLGYKSVFWSVAYTDWDTSKQQGGAYAFDTVTSRLHPGAIILLHSVSSDNAEALGAIIDYARNSGYEFRSLDDLPER